MISMVVTMTFAVIDIIYNLITINIIISVAIQTKQDKNSLRKYINLY